MAMKRASACPTGSWLLPDCAEEEEEEEEEEGADDDDASSKALPAAVVMRARKGQGPPFRNPTPASMTSGAYLNSRVMI
jgi:hypothetical protein